MTGFVGPYDPNGLGEPGFAKTLEQGPEMTDAEYHGAGRPKGYSFDSGVMTWKRDVGPNRVARVEAG